MENISNNIISGVSWNLLTQIIRHISFFCFSIILARLLPPEDFGLIAMVVSITGFMNLFSQFGLSSAIVQKQDINDNHLSTVFWLNSAIGLFLMILFMAASPFIAGFYNQPQLKKLSFILSITFLLKSLNIVQYTLALKNLNFKIITITKTVSMIIAGIIAVTLAYKGFGVWSLAAQIMSSSIITLIFFWIVSKWRPSFKISISALRELWDFSSKNFINQTLNYWVRHLDDILIGKYLGGISLGLYNRAYSLMVFPIINVSNVISRVLFPSFSKIQKDTHRVKNIYLKSVQTVALLTFPMMSGLYMTSEYFIEGVLGTPWLPIKSILDVFCIIGMTQSISSLSGSIFMSMGRVDLQLKMGLILKANLIAGIVIGLQYGVYGVAIGYAIASFINTFPSCHFSSRLIGATLLEILQTVAKVIICTILMCIGIWLIDLIIPEHYSSLYKLFILVLSGCLIYFLSINIARITAYEIIISQLKLAVTKNTILSHAKEEKLKNT